MNQKINRAPTQSDDYNYMFIRVMNALLREDLWGIISRGMITNKPLSTEQNNTWLCVPCKNMDLWVPVRASKVIQTWEMHPSSNVYFQSKTLKQTNNLEAILLALSGKKTPLISTFLEEFYTAIEHRLYCNLARDQWFTNKQNGLKNCWDSLWYHDRLASYHDHPFYATARAKLGLNHADLNLYAPEFSPVFKLRWIAVESSLVHQRLENKPKCFPTFTDIGLSEHLSKTHQLIPIHPYIWENTLNRLLSENHWRGKTIKAPKPFLEVTPTLSVRSVMVLHSPFIHLKLPLPMRTLGAKNIRLIHPSTLTDGAYLQDIVAHICECEPNFGSRILLTNEQNGAHVDHHPALGYILREYPKHLKDETLLPVASLCAQTPEKITVTETLIRDFYSGDAEAFFYDYFNLTIQFHLCLWVRYGITLEANQQNTLLILSPEKNDLRLLIKDNDAARIYVPRFKKALPLAVNSLEQLEDKRIMLPEETGLAEMFITIVLHLNCVALLESVPRATRFYPLLREIILKTLKGLENEGEDITLANQALFLDTLQPIKYMLTAGSLIEKTETGASDINKFYGVTGPNFLRSSW